MILAHYQYHINTIKEILSNVMKIDRFEIYLIRNDVEEEPYASSNVNQNNNIKEQTHGMCLVI